MRQKLRGFSQLSYDAFAFLLIDAKQNRRFGSQDLGTPDGY